MIHVRDLSFLNAIHIPQLRYKGLSGEPDRLYSVHEPIRSSDLLRCVYLGVS